MPNWVRPELPRRCGGLPGFLRRSRVSHPLVSVTHRTHTGADTGGGVPEWVPADAKIYIDLVNDRAWTETDGEVAIDTLLGSDPNTVNAWDVTSYNPANITEDGYVGGADEVAFIGSSLSMLLSGSTVRFAMKEHGWSFGTVSIALVSADGNDAIEIDAQASALATVHLFSWNGPLSLDSGRVLNWLPEPNKAINAFAFTLVGSRAEIAVNGSAPITGAVSNEDRPSGNPLVAALFFSDVDAIQSITIYDALPSTAGLSALSETGVENTAPTAITVETGGLWDHSGADISVINASYFDGQFYPLSVASCAFFGTDPEGNPLTFTVQSDTSGKVGINISNELTFSADPISDSPITFTVRATDPGGLYVEQEFTITVTA